MVAGQTGGVSRRVDVDSSVGAKIRWLCPSGRGPRQDCASPHTDQSPTHRSIADSQSPQRDGLLRQQGARATDDGRECGREGSATGGARGHHDGSGASCGRSITWAPAIDLFAATIVGRLTAAVHSDETKAKLDDAQRKGVAAQEELQRLLKPWRSAVCRITGKGCNAAPKNKRRMHPEESESELAEELEEELEEAVRARSSSLSIA